MRQDNGRRSPRPRRRVVILTTALMAILAALGVASPALAKPPKGILAPFADCPTTGPGVEFCIYSQTTSGEFKLGKTAVPINKTITLQGGLIPVPGVEGAYLLAPAKDGNTLSKTELNVPGGLTGLVNCTEIKGEKAFEKFERAACKAIFENKYTGVTATTELVATAQNPAVFDIFALFGQQGPALNIPVRIHLNNPLLGSSCYIGSASSPIQIPLTDGTTKPPPPNKPISGKLGTPSIEEEGEVSLIAVHENTLVENAFSAPAAEGCGGSASALIDPIIDARIGLPSPAGYNTAVLNGSLKLVSSEEVAESEK